MFYSKSGETPKGSSPYGQISKLSYGAVTPVRKGLQCSLSSLLSLGCCRLFSKSFLLSAVSFCTLVCLDDCICHLAAKQLDSADRVVVAGDDEVELFGIAVGIADTDQSDAQSMCLSDTDSLLLGIYYEDCIRNTGHVLDSAKVSLELIPLLLELGNFLLGKDFESAVLCHLLDLAKALNAAADSMPPSHLSLT